MTAADGKGVDPDVSIQLLDTGEVHCFCLCMLICTQQSRQLVDVRTILNTLQTLTEAVANMCTSQTRAMIPPTLQHVIVLRQSDFQAANSP